MDIKELSDEGLKIELNSTIWRVNQLEKQLKAYQEHLQEVDNELRSRGFHLHYNDVGTVVAISKKEDVEVEG